MAKEIKVNLGTSGISSSLYGALFNDTMQAYNAATPGFENYNPANWTAGQYCSLAWTETGATGLYTLDFPANIPSGYYWLDMRRRAGATPAESDATQLSELYAVIWDGVQSVDALRLSSPMKKNQAFPNFGFRMVSSTDHLSAFTGGVTGEVGLDGAVPLPLSTVPTLVSAVRGLYKVSFTAAELNGNSVVVFFNGSGADTRAFEFLLEA